MQSLDMRTVLLGYVLSAAICLAVVAALWRLSRGRFAGPGWWLANYACQFAALVLIALRGVVPVPVSVMFGSPLVIGGALLLLVGLERFVGKPGPQGHNVVLLAGFVVAQAYYGFVHPSLAARQVLLSLGLVALCSQAAWLLLRRVEAPERARTWATGVILGLYALVSLARAARSAAVPPAETLFSSGLPDVLGIFAYEMLLIALTFGLALMVSRRLLGDLESDNAARRRAEERSRALNEQLEQRVRERTAELEASLRELAEFSYSVSHDLRTPLRAVSGFSRILVEEHGRELGEDGRRLCTRINDGALQMGRLIDDLLAYVRLGRSPLAFENVDMGALAELAYRDVTSAAERERTDFHVAELPRAWCDPGLLRVVWGCLIGNAVKFSAGRERPAITVSAEPEGEEVVYAVRDNGVGFAMEHAGELFGLFRRVHPPGEYPGRGVGLAIARRILQRHDGRISAQGEPGAGATFRFALKASG